MPRPKRTTHKTHLANFLRNLIREKDISILEASRIAGCAPSVLHGWLQGSYPSETIDKLKKLANHFGYSLAMAMSGAPDDITNNFRIEQMYNETVVFNGLAKIKITKLERIGGSNEKS